jgi:TPP-dependent 2-oxoacid decarboxylase
MLTQKQKITIATLKNRGYDVEQIIEHLINTSQEATSWDIIKFTRWSYVTRK